LRPGELASSRRACGPSGRPRIVLRRVVIDNIAAISWSAKLEDEMIGRGATNHELAKVDRAMV
jgi:hypothetical protein